MSARGRSAAPAPWTACRRPAPAEALPESAEELGALVVTDVPSGLPRLPDDELEPPAGAKYVDDIAAYSDDPARERDVLEDYGYRHGWERFWGTGTGPMTGVFVDQFESRAGAGAYAEDLARNDAEHYGGVLHENPPDLPGGCRLLTVDDAEPDAGLSGPAALAWCGHGVVQRLGDGGGRLAWTRPRRRSAPSSRSSWTGCRREPSAAPGSGSR